MICDNQKPTLVYYLDDEPDLAEVFFDLIQAQGIQVRTFTDPLIFLSETAKTPPDIVFVDYRLPGMNGLEIAKKLSPKIHIALMTGELEIQNKAPALEVLSKPFEKELILKFIKEHSSFI